MNHAGNAVERPWGWALGLWMIIVITAVWGPANIRNSRLFQANFPAIDQAVADAWNADAVSSRLDTASYEALPIVLTIPFAVTRTQRMMVAKLKHRSDFANRAVKFRTGFKSSPSFVASLALLQASQYAH
jgi:hypothetical protein